MRRPARCGCGGREPRHVYLLATGRNQQLDAFCPKSDPEVRWQRPATSRWRKATKSGPGEVHGAARAGERTAPAERDVRRPFEADIGRARLRGVCRECLPLGAPSARAACPGRKEYCATPSQSHRGVFRRGLAETRPWTRRSRRSVGTRRRTRRRMSATTFRVVACHESRGAMRPMEKRRVSGWSVAARAAPRHAISGGDSAFLLAAPAVFAPVVDRAYHKLHTEGRVVSDVASVAYDVEFVAWTRRRPISGDARRRGRRSPPTTTTPRKYRGAASRRRSRGRDPRPRRLPSRVVGHCPRVAVSHSCARPCAHPPDDGRHFRVRRTGGCRRPCRRWTRSRRSRRLARRMARAAATTTTLALRGRPRVFSQQNVRAKRVIVRGTPIKEDALLDRIGSGSGTPGRTSSTGPRRGGSSRRARNSGPSTRWPSRRPSLPGTRKAPTD